MGPSSIFVTLSPCHLVTLSSSGALGLAGEDWHALGFSLGVSTGAVVLSLPFGVALGWLLARRRFAGKTIIEALLNLPLVLPPVVTGYLLLLLLGRRGLVGGWLYETFGVQIAFTWAAAMLAGAVMGFPLLVRAVRVAFVGIDPRLYQAARSLGASPLDAFLTVSLPLAQPGVVAGAVLAFARGLGEFGATLLFAGSAPGRRTLAVQLYILHEQPGAADEQRMWRLAVAAVLLACAALAVSEYLERRRAA
jgi:molybdate transport system permease protein